MPARPVDRAGHGRSIAPAGGLATLAKYGAAHVQTLIRHKGWTGSRRPDLAADLAHGRDLADLDRVAA